MTAIINEGQLKKIFSRRHCNSKGYYYQDNFCQFSIICAVLNTSFPLSHLHTYSAYLSSAYHRLLLVNNTTTGHPSEQMMQGSAVACADCSRLARNAKEEWRIG